MIPRDIFRFLEVGMKRLIEQHSEAIKRLAALRRAQMAFFVMQKL
jgi:hypothetical protein